MGNIKFQSKEFEAEVRKVLRLNKKPVRTDDIFSIYGVMIANQDASSISVPWSSGADAMNMRYPELIVNVGYSGNKRWIDDIKQFKHIKTLHLYEPTEELSFLEEFTDLRELYIIGSKEKDWTFIEKFTKLQFLYLDQCNFSDIAPIRKLCQMQQEAFDKKAKECKHAFILYEGLTSICLNNCEISDISPLAGCKYISELNLGYNEISDIRPLAQIKSIYWLTLSHNKIADIKPLIELEDTYSINLRHNQISDISVFRGFKNHYLGRLFLGHNNISDFTPLKNTHLVYCDIKQSAGRGVFIGGVKVNVEDQNDKDQG